MTEDKQETFVAVNSEKLTRAKFLQNSDYLGKNNEPNPFKGKSVKEIYIALGGAIVGDTDTYEGWGKYDIPQADDKIKKSAKKKAKKSEK